MKITSVTRRLAAFGLFALVTGFSACTRGKQSDPAAATSASQSGPKRYAFKGKVMAVDKNSASADIDNENIPGFMDEMVMAYTFKPASQIDQLKAGDTIDAEVVVDQDKSWLENVKVTGHSPVGAEKPTASVHIPQPGDEVPDFKLVNQSGKQVSLKQYRGETLLLTLIYTRCPFPDYCPRVSHEFAEIDRQVLADPSRYAKTHLLSISFDPAHDTPKVLRDYGFICAGSKDPKLFAHWEFAAIPQDELTTFANYFALAYSEEGGAITHSLSTAIISPEGKILKWYHGSAWRAPEILTEMAGAAHARA